MAKVMLSKKMRGILKDRNASQQLSKAIEQVSHGGRSGRVDYSGKVYSVSVNSPKVGGLESGK